MADTTFVNYQSPPIYAEWLNDVNNFIYKGRNPYFAVASMPTANTYVLTFPAGSQYMPIYGDVISFAVPTANTGASTLTIITSVQTVGPYTITQGGSALVANSLIPGNVYQATFNGSGFSIPIVGAPLANPAFTGVPTAPTATAGTNTTQLATTAFVTSAVTSIATGHGQCRLSKSGANLLLSPFGGRALIINNVTQSIPSAGITLAPTGLTATVTYFIYAYMNAGVMTLEASNTGHSTDTNGVEIKTGDSTRTLVGMVYVVTGPSFQDTMSQRCVISWFNVRPIPMGVSSTSSSVTTTTYTEFNVNNRLQFVTWGIYNVNSAAACTLSIGTANQNGHLSLGFDGSTTTAVDLVKYSLNVSEAFGLSVIDNRTLSEGFHYITPIGKADSAGVTVSLIGALGTTQAMILG